jgi:FtsP/CotA-like multicopper oxidase with cupredoxin domain
VYRPRGADEADYGTIMPPVLRWRKGSRTPVTLHNALDPVTHEGWMYGVNMHTHGLHISGAVDDITVAVPPGGSHTYKYELPANHAGGVSE